MSENFDKEVLETTKSLMGEKFPQIVEAYIRNTKQYMEKIEQSIESQNYAGIAEDAHPLKSASAMMGMMGMSEVSAQLEDISNNFDSLDRDQAVIDIERHFDTMKSHFTFAQQTLEAELA